MASIQGDDGTPSGFLPNRPYGVWGDSGTGSGGEGGGNGVVGTSANYTGIAGFTQSTRNDAAGVFGGGHIGVAGGVAGSSTFPSASVGVYGTGSNRVNLGATGVEGESDTGTGVYGHSTSGDGVLGLTTGNVGGAVAGFSSGSATGTIGWSNQGSGIFGIGGALAGEFIGNVDISGNLTKGGGGFKIDHPLDPAMRYLSHSFVESPDMKNVYDGATTLDANGEAVVELPDWFEALNTDFRYQLTSIGAPAPALHIAQEITNHRFRITGGAPGLKVCWQVTGTRHDAWAQANRIVVEQNKPAHERDSYLHPEVHGQPSEKGILAARHPDLSRRFGQNP